MELEVKQVWKGRSGHGRLVWELSDGWVGFSDEFGSNRVAYTPKADWNKWVTREDAKMAGYWKST